MRIAHLPTSVGGHAWGLAQGEKALGLQSDVIYLRDNFLKYPSDKIIFPDSTNTFIKKFTRFIPLVKEVRSIMKNYDVFHFNFGSSIFDFPKANFQLLDIPYFKKHGKIIVTYNGCDARQKYPTMQRVDYAACHNTNCYGGMCNSGELDKLRRSKIEKFNRYADAIFALNPDLLYFLPERARFLPYAVSRWDDLELFPFREVKEKFTIVHAPTNQAAKGSEIIIPIVEQIKAKYPDKINFILVENLPNHEAVKIYAQADVIIDQIMIGWYGGFAVEAMKMGKPVMVFIREEDLKFIPAQMAADCNDAFINVWQGNLFDKLCNLIENPSQLKLHREAALDYVNRWHNPLYVASLVKEAYLSPSTCAE